jgi:hypothetical protein
MGNKRRGDISAIRNPQSAAVRSPQSTPHARQSTQHQPWPVYPQSIHITHHTAHSTHHMYHVQLQSHIACRVPYAIIAKQCQVASCGWELESEPLLAAGKLSTGNRKYRLASRVAGTGPLKAKERRFAPPCGPIPDPHLALLQGDTQSRRLPPVRCASAGAEGRGGVLCADPALCSNPPGEKIIITPALAHMSSVLNRHSIDFLALTETHLEDDLLVGRLRSMNWNAEVRERDNISTGGVAIVIHKARVGLRTCTDR